MRTGLWAIAMAVGLGALDCGGDDTPTKSEPQQKCESFATTWCQKSVECLVKVGTLPEAQRTNSEGTCTDVGIAALQCKRAASVGSTYSQCISDVQAMDCSIWNVPADKLSTIQPPSTCQGIIIISP